jgi:phage tail-like protein
MATQVTQTNTAARIATDPLRNFKFTVTISPIGRGTANSPAGSPISAGFMSVAGLNVTVSVIAYRAGNMNTTTQKMPGQADFSPVVLSRGVAVGASYELYWLKQLFQVAQGTSSSAYDTTGQFPNGVGSDFRATIHVGVLGHPITGANAPVNAIFKIYNAWPTSVAYSDLDAGANQLLISQMTLAHEGWDLKIANSVTQSVSL